MADNFENTIFDFGQLEGTEGYVLDNELTIAILKGDTGDKIGRLMLEEQPHYDSIVYYPGFNKIQKSLNNYMFMKGKLKVCYEWTDDEGITQETTEKFWEIQSNNPEHPHATTFKESNKCGFTLDYGGYVTSWTNRSLEWELATNKAYLEALQDNTVVICAMGTTYSWSYKNIDLPSQQTTTFNKEGEICYLLTGNDSEVTVGETTHIFSKYDCKKLSSSACSIKNVSDETSRIIAIYK